MRESLVVTNVHRVLGIVNGTTNFVLTEMESGSSYDDALASAQARGYAEADPTDDVSGADAAAKMAILATVAFNSRVTLDDVRYSGITTIDPADVAAARRLDMAIRLVGAARLVDGQVDVSVHPALVDNQHPLAKVDGAFNAVMLQGDAIREITLEGPGAGGVETASAVIADITSVIGTMGTGFLENDAAWRDLPTLPEGDSRSPFYFRLHVEDRPGALARVAEGLAEREISVARLLQHANGNGAALHVVTHEARAGGLEDALSAIGQLADVHSELGAVARHLRPRRRGARMDVGAFSLGEGSTPLVRAQRATTRLGRDVFLKCEGVNPTGSFKDRGMVRAVAGAFGEGARAVCCASTGNTAASAAAYAARAGLDAIVLTPAGAAATAKRAQARACGARVVEIRGSFDDALRLARELGQQDGYVLVNSLNPLRIEGQKTVVTELLDELQSVPEVIALPYGGGGNVSAVAAAVGDAGVETRIVVGQAAERTTTWASAIRIGEPAHRANCRGTRRGGTDRGRDPLRGRSAACVGAPRPRGGRVLRAGVRGRPGRARAGVAGNG